MSGWRVWFAFEVRPGVPASRDLDFRAIREACRDADGKVDRDEFVWLVDVMTDAAAMTWGDA